MPGRYKNSHVNMGQIPAHSSPRNSDMELRVQYQSEAPPLQIEDQSFVVQQPSPRISEDQVEVGRGYISPRQSVVTRSSGVTNTFNRSLGKMDNKLYSASRGANRAVRGGGDTVAGAYKCLKLLFIIDVAVFLILGLLGIFPIIFGWAIAWAFSYFLPLLPALIMEIICLIKGVDDRNYNFIDCTIKVRTIGNAVMLFIGIILLIIGIIMLAMGHTLTWATTGGIDKYYGSAIFYSGLAWFFAGIYAGIILWFIRREWAKLSGRY